MENEFQFIPTGKIKESKTNPRKHFDEVSLKELAETIKKKGIHEPLLMRPMGDGYELVAGARRLRAAKMAKLEKVPAIVKSFTDEEALEIQVVENLQREDIHPLDEATGYQALMNKGAYDVKLLCEKVGKSEKYILGRLRLNKLIKPMRDLYDTGYLQLGHILLASRHNNETQQKILTFLQLDQDSREDWENLPEKIDKSDKADTAPSVKVLHEWLKDNSVYDLSKVKFDITDKLLVEGAGDCKSCRKNTSNDLTLFEGIKKNFCTDRICREKKTTAHIMGISARHGNAVLVQEHYYPSYKLVNVPEVIPYNEFSLSAKGQCEDTVPAVIAQSDAEDHLGNVIYICRNKNCKKHKGKTSGSSGPSAPSQTPQQRAYNEERKIKIQELNHSRKELHLKVVHAFGQKPNLKQLLISMILTTNNDSINFTQYEAIKYILPANFKAPKDEPYDSEEISLKVLNLLTENDLMVLLFSNYTSDSVKLNNWQDYEREKNTIGKSDRLTVWSKMLMKEKDIAAIIEKHKVERKQKKVAKKKAKKKYRIPKAAPVKKKVGRPRKKK